MTTLRTAAQQALEAMSSFESGTGGLYEGEFSAEIAALRAALAEPEQEPVAHQDTADKCLLETVPAKGTLFHTAPLQRKPLTDDDIQALWEKAFDSGSSPNTFARAIEAAHGIKESI